MELFDERRVADALRILGETNTDALECVYCGKNAQTWDHVYPLVSGGEMSGYGHTLGNLVPSCRDCNSEKGSQDWRAWLESTKAPMSRIEAMEGYLAAYPPRRETLAELEELCPELVREFQEKRAAVLSLLGEADRVAQHIREKVVGRATSVGNQSK